MILVILAAVVFVMYAPQGYTDWRERRLLERARRALAADDYREATKLANEILRFKSESLPAFQVLAEATEKLNQPDTVTWRAQIARLVPNDLESQLNLASAALRFDQLDLARRALENVPAPDRDKAAYHVVAGWLARAHGDEEGQRRHFTAAVERDPGNDVYQFNLAVLDIKSEDVSRSEAARKILERLSNTTAYRTGSLRVLLGDAIRRENYEAAERLANDLQLSQQATFPDLLLCLDLYQKLDRKKSGALLEKVKSMAERNRGDIALLMEWMIRMEMAADVIRWMEKMKPEQTNMPPASVAVAEAFAALKNWSRLRRWTRSGAWGNAEYLRLAYQSYAARQARGSGVDAEAHALWRSAEESTAQDPEAAARLARLASTWELTSEAEQLWLRVAKHPQLRREALEALYGIYRKRNELEDLLQTAQRLHEAVPYDTEVAANYARLALLLDRNAADAHRIANEAYERQSGSLNTAVTYAFSLYAQGRTADGVAILNKIDPKQLEDPHAAAFAAVLLIDDNRFDTARPYLHIAQKADLFPEEKRLLEDAAERLRQQTPPGEDQAPPSAEESAASPTPASSPR